MKLYEISELYHDFMYALEAGEIPEETIADTLEAIEGTFIDKADNIACMIKSYEAEAKAIKEEKKILEQRAKEKENHAEWLKQYLANHMMSVGMAKVESPRVKLSFRKSKAVEAVNESECIAYLQQIGRDDCLTFKEPTLNRTALKEAIQNGEVFEGIALVERQNLQIR